ncbi:MAG: 4Fe-4S dicluster domain-containing protein [Deltaproteobacteria bacterium]|nr:4Fe-4S dicluster domain-containing protein [Deltaproteobacteria bacterium]
MSEMTNLSRRQVIKGAGAVAVGAAVGLVPAGTALAARKSRKRAPRWTFIIDLRRCIGCRACTVACKAEFHVPLGAFRTAVYEEVNGAFPRAEKFLMPRICNHCEGNVEDGIPPCVKICPEYPKGRKKFITAEGKTIRYRYGATYKRPDGLILYDNELCIGCGKCIDKCPYGARTWNKRLTAGKDSTKNGIAKCTLCQHRIDRGVEPACVNICQGRARIFGDLNDPNSEVSRLVKEFKLEERRNETTLLPGENTVPMCFYIDPRGVLQNMATAKKKFVGNEAWVDQVS